MDVITKLQSMIHDEDGFRLVAGSMNQLLVITENDNSSTKELVDAVLKQVSLTERLLNLANSVGMHSAFTQSISTVQGAALLLGTDNVRRIAVMLTAYEGVSRIAPNSKAWLQEFQVALLASELARKLSCRPGFGVDEECATVTLLRGISRILTACASPRARQAIISRALSEGVAFEVASKTELGLSYSSISQSAVLAWGLPEHLYARVGPVTRPVEKLGASYSVWMQAVSACAYDIAECSLFSVEKRPARLQAVMRNFASVTPATLPALLQLFSEALQAVGESATSLGLPLVEEASSDKPSVLNAIDNGLRLTSDSVAASLTNALGEIAVAATQGRPLELIFGIAVEGLARSLGASRTALVLRNGKKGVYEAVASHGMSRMQAEGMQFPMRYTPDVISAVLSAGRDFVASDMSKIASKLPSWYRSAFGSESRFALFPLTDNGEPIGFLYADWPMEVAMNTDQKVHGAVSALKSQLGLVLRMQPH